MTILRAKKFVITIIKIVSIVILIYLSSCSFNKAIIDSERLLRQELFFWNDIRLEGTVTVNKKQLSLHKFFVFQKNEFAGRLDIMENGFWGVSNKPFFSAYIDSLLFVRIPNSDKIITETISLPEFLPNLMKLQNQSGKIIRDKSFGDDKLNIFFSKKMRIKRLSIRNSFVDIIISRNSLGIPSTITILQKNTVFAEFEIDKITHNINYIRKMRKRSKN